MYRIFIVICILSISISGCQGKFKTKEELVKEGASLLASGNPGGAIVLLKNALDKDQKYYDARLLLAKAYAGAGKYDAAEKELQKLVRQRPESRDVHIEMAKIHLRKSRPDEALKELAAGSGTTGENTEEKELRAWAYTLKGRYDDAVNLLTKAVAEDPGRISIKMALARVHARNGARKEANALIADVLTQEPGHREALYLLAAVRIEQRDFGGAQNAYDALLKEKPNDLDALYRKGILHIEIREYDAALAIGDRLVKLSEKSAAGHLIRGIALYNKKQLKDASLSLQKAVAIQPAPAAYYYLSITLYGLREFEQATGQIQRALDQNPSFAQGRVLLAMILMSKKQVDDAIREAKKAVELDNDNASAHDVLGNAYFAKGMFSEGIAEINRALELNPKLVDAHIKKGLFQLSKGRTSEGEVELITAVRISPEILNSRMVLATHYQRNGAHGKALQVLQEGLSGVPADAVLYNMMAESYLQQNKLNDAITCYQKARNANPEDAHAPLRLASVYVTQGERPKAITELTAYVDRFPGNTRVITALAALQEAAGNDSLARSYYKQARKIGTPEGYLEESRYYLRKRDIDAAIDLLNDAIKKYPSHESLHEFKGKVQLASRKYPDAVKTFEELDKLNPRTGLPLLLNAYGAAGEHKKALEKVDKELRKDPKRLDLGIRKTGIYLLLGKKQEAENNARFIISSHPREGEGYMALAMVYRKEGDLGKAIETLSRAPVQDPELSLMLASLLVQKKDYGAALTQCRKAEELKKNNLPAIFQTGSLLHTMGRKQEAIDKYRQVLRIEPNHAPALNNLAYLYVESGHDLDQALQYAVRAYVLTPGDGSVNDTLGYVLLRKGKIEESLKALKNAVALIPDNATIHYHLGLAYREHGDKALAVESLSKAISLGEFPQQAEAKRLLDQLGKEKRS